MQSDGKSSFIEALLGFQFNTVDTQIGTRRPIVLQMIRNDQKFTPLIHFFKEDLSGFEDLPISPSKIENELRKRTEKICGKFNVSSRPIILRIEYKNCANLTIYDTPGFRKLKNNDNLSEKISKMVLKLIKPKNRIIICLEQSTVEWCNTEIRPIIEKIDPKFERTIFITTKLNNRTNQFKNAKEMKNYFLDGLKISKKNFFISLPSGPNSREISDEEFKEKIVGCYLNDLKVIFKLDFHFDEKNENKKILENFGFLNFKIFLENFLNKKYKENLIPVLNLLETTIEKKNKNFQILQKEISEIESENVEKTVNHLISEFLINLRNLIKGTVKFETLKNGMTLEEEKEKSGSGNWPNFNLNEFKIRNSQFKLYGGAQLERLLTEFEIVAHSQEFPQTSDDEVVVTLGFSNFHTMPDFDRAASDLVQKKTKMIFLPLIDVLIQRIKFIMKNLWKILIENIIESKSIPENYKNFFENLEKISEEFNEKILNNVKEKINDEFLTFTKIIDWNLVDNLNFIKTENTNFDFLNPSKEETLKRVQETISEKFSLNFSFSGNDKSRDLNEEKCKLIKIAASKLFSGIRLLFVKFIRAKFNAFFIDPLYNEMDDYIRNYFNEMGSDKLKEMIGFQISKLKGNSKILEEQLKKLNEQMEKFKKVNELVKENNLN